VIDGQDNVPQSGGVGLETLKRGKGREGCAYSVEDCLHERGTDEERLGIAGLTRGVGSCGNQFCSGESRLHPPAPEELYGGVQGSEVGDAHDSGGRSGRARFFVLSVLIFVRGG
jgi:hypothetical protein